MCIRDSLVNDIWGLKRDPKRGVVSAKYQAPCCLMHNRQEIKYENFLEDFIEDLQESVRLAEEAGIAKDKIILDPGVGFAKTYEMNLEIIPVSYTHLGGLSGLFAGGFFLYKV